jgi:hypothetical protein
MRRMLSKPESLRVAVLWATFRHFHGETHTELASITIFNWKRNIQQ